MNIRADIFSRLSRTDAHLFYLPPCPTPPFHSPPPQKRSPLHSRDKSKEKNVLITGTSLNGIGFESARVIAKHANLVIMTGHNSDRLNLAADTIKRELPSANIRPLILDLSSLDAVRKAAGEVNAFPEPLHVLIHNAAAPIGPFKLTVDNLESQVATDHICPFLFTKLVAPKILSARTEHYTPRVIFVSSIGHGIGTGVNFDTLGRPDPTRYVPMEAYYQAKSANVLTAIELSKRSKGQINAYSLHPGGIYTNIMNPASAPKEAVEGLHKLGLLEADGTPRKDATLKTMGQGAATTLVAAFDPRLDDKSGAYLNDCVAANELIGPPSSDPANAERLWNLTEQIIGETFTF
ncbi:Short-chain dehydrogenase/reductase family protein [Mycena venus]|uniref:Short-chain dehydrogenase/reductase family protein n=1 Tax=Mycena venus TaxID=2733690 RepID=A0A8H6YTP2_9AGAR|nr:Short-chain dehydrogenase/reductase family protein [Mycena venus]